MHSARFFYEVGRGDFGYLHDVGDILYHIVQQLKCTVQLLFEYGIKIDQCFEILESETLPPKFFGSQTE